jgi:cysteine-rich repeat protein
MIDPAIMLWETPMCRVPPSLRIPIVWVVLLAALSAPARAGDEPLCTLYSEAMEDEAPGWTSFVPSATKIGAPPGPSTWHLDDTTCRGDALTTQWYVSNGNDGPGCVPDSAREHSVLVGPPIALPGFGTIVLEFDSLSYDEAGSCLASATFDEHDVGISLDGGTTWTRLNDCTPLADGSGVVRHHTFDLAPWAGATVQVVFAYDTRDDRNGHTFAVDNVTVRATVCSLDCGDGDLDDGEACDDGNNQAGDGCRPDCTLEACGDGILDPQEECEDGNTVHDDACGNDCIVNFCGDGEVENGEPCDDGNDDLGDGCRPD